MDSTVSVGVVHVPVSEATSPTNWGWVSLDKHGESFEFRDDHAATEVDSPVLSSQHPIHKERPEGRLVQIFENLAPNGSVTIETLGDVGESLLNSPGGIQALSMLTGAAPLRALLGQQELPSDVLDPDTIISREEMIERAKPVIQDRFPQASAEEATRAAEDIVSKIVTPIKHEGSGTKAKKTRDLKLLALVIGTLAITVLLRYKKGGFNNTTPLMKSALNKVINFIRG